MENIFVRSLYRLRIARRRCFLLFLFFLVCLHIYENGNDGTGRTWLEGIFFLLTFHFIFEHSKAVQLVFIVFHLFQISDTWYSNINGLLVRRASIFFLYTNWISNMSHRVCSNWRLRKCAPKNGNRIFGKSKVCAQGSWENLSSKFEWLSLWRKGYLIGGNYFREMCIKYATRGNDSSLFWAIVLDRKR